MGSFCISGVHNDPQYAKALELHARSKARGMGKTRGTGQTRGGYQQQQQPGYTPPLAPYPLGYNVFSQPPPQQVQHPQQAAAQYQYATPAAPRPPPICYNCGLPGHMSKFCHLKLAPAAAAGAPPPPPK